MKLIHDELESEVFSLEFETEMRTTLHDFELDDFKFHDTWEIDGMDWTYHYLWCLHAIVWGIDQYDAVKKKAEAA